MEEGLRLRYDQRRFECNGKNDAENGRRKFPGIGIEVYVKWITALAYYSFFNNRDARRLVMLCTKESLVEQSRVKRMN